MTRPVRVIIPESFYHVTARGNNRGEIFCEDGDYARYLELLLEAWRRFRVEVHAYCLMPNHLHLLLSPRESCLSAMIDYLHGEYARTFNFEHQRTGHLFQGRFHSRVVADERYLHEVGRYIHMNPVRAGLVQRPEDYPWSSFRAYLDGTEERPGFLTCTTLMASFSGRNGEQEFVRYTHARVDCAAEGLESYGEERWYAPRGEGVRLESREKGLNASMSSRGETGSRLLQRIIEPLGLTAGQINRPLSGHRETKEIVEARLAAVWVMRRISRESWRGVADVLGYSSVQSAANALLRAENLMERDERFQGLVQRMCRDSLM